MLAPAACVQCAHFRPATAGCARAAPKPARAFEVVHTDVCEPSQARQDKEPMLAFKDAWTQWM